MAHQSMTCCVVAARDLLFRSPCIRKAAPTAVTKVRPASRQQWKYLAQLKINSANCAVAELVLHH